MADIKKTKKPATKKPVKEVKKVAKKAPVDSKTKETKKKKKIKVTFSKPDFKNLNKRNIVKYVGLAFVIVGSFALIDLAVQYLNNDYSVAVVNGARISKKEWHNLLEGAYGEAAAQQLIEEEIIQQEAKLADVSVSKEEIDTEIADIVDSIGGQELYASALEANNITEDELRYQIEIDLLAQKILEPQVSYTEDDVKEFFDQYSDVIFSTETEALEDGEKLNYDDYATETEEVYIQQQVETLKVTWLAEKESEYRIQDNSTGKPAYGFLTTTRNIFKNLAGTTDEVEE
jgi:hypothetical protein